MATQIYPTQEVGVFLFQLEPDEKQAFLPLAARVCAVDGVDPRETERLALFERETGFVTDDNDGRSLEELCRAIKSRRSRMSAMIELVAISFADEEQSDEELSLLAEIADSLGLDQDDIASATDWVLRQRELIADANQLWGQ